MEKTYTKLAEELARVRTIVESAVGAQADRGDRVTVECVQFAPVVVAASEPAVDAIATMVKQNGLYAAVAVAALLALAVLMLVRGRRKKKQAAAALVLAGGSPLRGASLDGAAPVAVSIDARPLGGGTPEQLAAGAAALPLASDIVRDDPKLAAQIVRGWLAETV